ncbi:uncharacterized protein LOC130677223 [Microplitis mediator]|uniref:uncharacterized protein LOC130677223 n=1 Tax=Microplitis mediator TaxID=375433 RepID=UPI002553DB18|nr:uncharacterized protein LOC130677223 [Microplitis mediator]
MDSYDERDEVVDAVINQLSGALDNPRQISSRGSTDNLHHLLEELEPLVPPSSDDDQVIDLLETIIRESTPTNSSAPSTSHSFNESPSILSTDSRRGFWSKLFKRKSQRSSEGSQDPAEGSHDPAEPSKYSLPSIGSANDSSASASALKAAENYVAQLEDSGPGDLTSVSALGREINRRICVWSSSMTLRREVGSGRPGDPINVQFHSQPEDIIGHWSLIGNEEPQNTESGLNDCLFNAISAQTGHKPSELRDITVARMRTNIRSVANRIRELARREECDRIVLMVGGAMYFGNDAGAAGRLLKDCQRKRSDLTGRPGHPRGHVSRPGCPGPFNSAENYSMFGCKTAFMSIDDQNELAHRVLKSQPVHEAMVKLNEGSDLEVVRVEPQDIGVDENKPETHLPKGLHFNEGVVGEPQEIRGLVIILHHSYGKRNKQKSDVFVYTFYPILKG